MSKKMSKKMSSQQMPVSSIMESARQIWLAGLGAFAKAEEEGSKLFENLVKEGEEIESHTRKAVKNKVAVVTHKLEDTVDVVKDKATDTWDEMEQLFEDRVARLLLRLGVPTNEDIQELTERVEDLNDTIKNLLEKY
jgi:poly(hydroxyalkanoate) granule-associated protein